MALTDEEFSTKFHAAPTHLRKIQLAIAVSREMGKSLKMYLKGFFAQNDNGTLVIEFTVQSLRDEESL